MKINNILSKVYRSSAAIIVSTIVLACFVCKWPLATTVVAVLASFVISSPSTISLHLLFLLTGKIRMKKGFVWMVLLASIPVSSFIAALLFADYVPGKVWILLLLGILSGYAGILMNGISVSEFFNPSENENE
jgi:hypothetical protein